MEFIYVLVSKDSEWEDMVIFLSVEEAIKESIKYPEKRIEIFSKSDKSGYTPTYNYYKNGELRFTKT
jgi:hypothetical protein